MKNHLHGALAITNTVSRDFSGATAPSITFDFKAIGTAEIIQPMR
ncbi:MAG: hypothetical protein QM802_20235 [Agriterribacter sp.]